MGSLFTNDAFIIVFLVTTCLSLILYTSYSAKRAGRGPIVWGLDSAVFGLFALAILIGVSKADEKERSKSPAAPSSAP